MDNPNYASELESELSQRIKAARLSAGLKQAEVAKKLASYGVKLGPSAFAKLERGERGIDFAEAVAIADLLQFPIGDFVPSVIDEDQALKLTAKRLSTDAQSASSHLDAASIRLGNISKEMIKLAAMLEKREDSIRDVALLSMAKQMSEKDTRHQFERFRTMVDTYAKLLERFARHETYYERYSAAEKDAYGDPVNLTDGDD